MACSSYFFDTVTAEPTAIECVGVCKKRELLLFLTASLATRRPLALRLGLRHGLAKPLFLGARVLLLVGLEALWA